MSNSKCIYVLGDIHGRKDLLIAIRELIVADASEHRFEDKTIICVGDYVDRGFDSKGVIELLMNEPLEGFTHINLKGNHEEIMYKGMEWSTRNTGASIQDWRDMWMLNGGVPTVRSYGVQPNPIADWTGAAALFDWNEVKKAVPKEHIYWMKALPIYHIDGDYLFVHAGIKPGVPLAKQDPRTMMWIRNTFLDSTLDHGYRIIHGHCPTKGFVDIRANRVNMDTGAVFNGVMFALAIHDGEERLIQTPQFETMDEMKQRL